MERAMQYRFHDSQSLTGHSLGNLFIAAMSDMEGSVEDGLAAISQILKVHGRVWPNTSENIQLKALMDDGSTVVGESAITASPHKIVRLMTEPENPEASQRGPSIRACWRASSSRASGMPSYGRKQSRSMSATS